MGLRLLFECCRWVWFALSLCCLGGVYGVLCFALWFDGWRMIFVFVVVLLVFLVLIYFGFTGLAFWFGVLNLFWFGLRFCVFMFWCLLSFCLGGFVFALQFRFLCLVRCGLFGLRFWFDALVGGFDFVASGWFGVLWFRCFDLFVFVSF